MSTFTQPVADIGITYTPSGNAAGAVVVDLALSPAGDAALVTGAARLAQDLTRFMSTPAGAYFADPTWGTALWAQIGRPTEADDEVYVSAVEEAEAAFLHGQTVAAAAGYLDLGAQLQAITDTRIDRSVPGQIAVGFVAQTRSGESVSGAVPVGS